MTKLSDYVEFQNGYAFKSSEYASSGHYLIRIKNVQQGFIEISDKCYVGISKSSDLNKFELKNGDIVISLTGNVGRIARIKSEHLPAALNQRVAKVATKNEKILNSEYLYYLLRTPKFFEFAINSGKGAAQQNISTSDMSNFSVNIPTLQNQLKIVVKLDKAFAEIDSLEKNLQLKEDKTNQLLQSMLSAAFTNIEEFDMKTVQLKEACDFFGDGDWIESKDQSDSGIRLIQTGNVGIGEFKDRIEKARWISEETFRSLRCTEIIEGDVLVSRLPDPVGRACLIPHLSHKAITAVDCAIIRFNPSRIIPKFFIYYSQSNEYYSTIRPLISGSTRERISREKLGNLLIPQPTILEQKVIIQKLDMAFAEIEKLKNQITIEKERISTLRQSILSDAFNFEEKAA